MTKVTQYFEKFMEASRHMRNTYYVPDSEDDWDIVDDFDELSILLFKHLVCIPLGVNLNQFDWLGEPMAIFKLKARGQRLPIMINRKPNIDHGNWEHEISSVEPNDLELTFIDYFDWDPKGMIDYRYIMCRITGAEVSKNVIGHTALVESHYVDIYYDESANN